jgi:hypothetical protein
MARSCPPWVWVKSIRDCLIEDHAFRTASIWASAFMDKTGHTFVGQKRLANAAGVSVPTIRKGLRRAWEAEFLGVSSGDRQGKRWRNHRYTCCIPDALPLSPELEAIVDAHCSIHGDVDTDTHPEGYFRGDAGKPALPPSVDKRNENIVGGKDSPSKLAKDSANGGKEFALKVANQLCTKSYSEEVLSVSLTKNKHASSDACALSESNPETSNVIQLRAVR